MSDKEKNRNIRAIIVLSAALIALLLNIKYKREMVKSLLIVLVVIIVFYIISTIALIAIDKIRKLERVQPVKSSETKEEGVEEDSEKQG